MPFKIGDKAVYAAHGVGEVTAIERREISGKKQSFYILRLLDTGSTLMVPTDKESTSALRGVISRRQASEVIAILKQKRAAPRPGRQTWNRRHREYMEKLHGGSVFEVAEVLRELTHLRSEKDLSFSERKVLELARSLVVRELAVARRAKESRIESELDAILRCG